MENSNQNQSQGLGQEGSPSPTSASEFPLPSTAAAPKTPRRLERDVDEPAMVTPSPNTRGSVSSPRAAVAAAAASLKAASKPAPSPSSTTAASANDEKEREKKARQAALQKQSQKPPPQKQKALPPSYQQSKKKMASYRRQASFATATASSSLVPPSRPPPAAASAAAQKPAAKATLPSTSTRSSNSNDEDEKTRLRQERQRALEQQQGKPRASSIRTSEEGRPLKQQEKEDLMATKRASRISLPSANARALPPPPPMASLIRRTTSTSSSASNNSSGSMSTTVTQNTNPGASRRSSVSEEQIQAVSLILEDDDGILAIEDDDNNNDDGDDDKAIKDRARASSSMGQQRVARRHTTNSNSTTDTSPSATTGSNKNLLDAADEAVKRSARRSAGVGVGRPRRATHLGLPRSSSHGSSGASSTSSMEFFSESHHSTASSSVGAHSVMGGGSSHQSAKKDGGLLKDFHRRPTSKRDGDEDDDEDDDAVQQHLASLAFSQNSSEHSYVPRLVMPDVSSDDEDSSKFTLSSTHSSKVRKMSSHAAILEEDYDLEEGEEFAGDNDNNEGGVGLEAEAGVPVLQVQPGAFAVDGVDAHSNDTDSAASEEEDLEDFDTMEQEVSVVDTTLTDPTSALFMDPESLPQCLEAELHQEAVLVDAQVLTDDPEDLSPKARRRLRFMQCTVFCLALSAIAAVVGVTMTRPESDFGGDPWEIPTIEGWKQVGLNLTGPTDDDKSLYGYSISMAETAERIAVGVPGRDQSETELSVGEVHLLDWNGTQWLPSGLPLVGPGPGAQAGTAVALSKNGKRVAIGSPYFMNGGHVSVYEETEPETWELVGQVLVADNFTEDSDARFGGALALSEEGDILVVGAALGEDGNSTDNGFVRVFQLLDESEWEAEEDRDQADNTTNSASSTSTSATSSSSSSSSVMWVQMGEDIVGEHSGDFFGWSLAATGTGTRIAVGAVGSTGGNEAKEFLGQVRVFDYDQAFDSWVQTGQSMSGMAAFDSFGSSVALSELGDVLAVGAIGHSSGEDGVDIGHVRLFQLTGGEDNFEEATWEPLGQTLLGQNAFESFGFSVSLSSDGMRIAAGGPRNDAFAESSGHIQVFELDPVESSWRRLGSNIGGSYLGRDLFGWSCALSSDGTRIAGGAPFSTYDGKLSDVGTVRIYDVDGNVTLA